MGRGAHVRRLEQADIEADREQAGQTNVQQEEKKTGRSTRSKGKKD